MAPDLTIRQIQPGDNASLATIIRETLVEFRANHCGTVYYDPTTDALYELFLRPGSVYFVAEQDGVILGGAGIFPSEGLPDKTCELVKMYLIPSARGKGLGKELIQRSLQFARDNGYQQVYIETMPELKKAMRIYEQFGFQYLPSSLGHTGHTGCEIWMLMKL